MPEPLLVVLVGPTGSGKTALSLKLAEALNGEIVSCDSVAVYQEMELGTAKPSREQRVFVPHHLIDVVPPNVEYTAGDYGRAARTAISNIAARCRTPIVVGGTGLYLRALLDGLSPMPARNEALRKRLLLAVARRGGHVLHRVLRRLDPVAAATIHTNDLHKLIRAIEVSIMAGRPMSDAWQARLPQPLTGFRVVQLGLSPERTALYRNIDARCETMFEDGLVAETATLVARYGPACHALHALGYREAQGVLRGAWTAQEAMRRVQQGHRNYAKRQGTWFRRDTRIHWLHTFGSEAFDDAVKLLLA